MRYEKINLKDYFPLPYDVTLTCYCPDNFLELDLNRKRKSILVCPGGGYGFVSDREAEPIALQFLGEDYNAFVLTYSINEKAFYPTPILEAFAAIAYMRKYADKYNVDVNKILIMGFSAGGHLAASASAFWHKEEYAKMLNVTNEDIKINGSILCYPVISCNEYGHLGTVQNISHQEPELVKLLSIEDQVSKYFPKSFIWHTAKDRAVDIHNSLMLCSALSKNDIDYELHIFKNGQHGLSLANEITKPVNYDACVVPQTEIWFSLLKKYIKEEF